MTNALCPITVWLPGVRRHTDIPARWLDRWAERNADVGQPGPGEGTGTLLGPAGPILAYRPDLQRWDNRGDFWIGARLDAAPADFVRDPQVSSSNYGVVLGDGQTWQIPVANPLVDSLGLPYWRKLDEHGQKVREVKDAYRDLSWRAAELAGRWKDAYLAQGNGELEMDDDAAEDLLTTALAVNYDITPDEISVLRLLDPGVYFSAIAALIDWPTTAQLLAAQASDPPTPTEATSGT